MTPAGTAPIGLARERAVEQRRIAGRTEWIALSALGGVRRPWHDLAARALEPNVFYHPAFALAAAPAFGTKAGAVLTWSKAGRLIGLFPARLERRYGVMRALTGWTHPYAPLGVPLVDRAEADAAIAAFLDHVESDAALPKLVMLPMIGNGPFAAALDRVLARGGGAAARFGAHARALLAPAETRANYLDHIPHKKTKELRRQRRRLAGQGVIELATARDPQAVAAALDDFLTLEAGGWKGRQGSAAHAHPAIRAFMQSAVATLAAEGNARIDRLMRGDRAIAASITLRSGSAAWFWKIAYDEGFARNSPGVQLTLDLTQNLLADETIAQVDSCATAGHPMIDHLWRERLALADLLIAPSAAALAPFRVALHLEAGRRALVDVAKRLRDLSRDQA